MTTRGRTSGELGIELAGPDLCPLDGAGKLIRGSSQLIQYLLCIVTNEIFFATLGLDFLDLSYDFFVCFLNGNDTKVGDV